MATTITKTEVDQLQKKYPDRIPILLRKGAGSIEIKRRKYLVPSSITFANFIHSIRKTYTIPPEKAMFFYINETLPSNSESMALIYQKWKNADGMLVVTYSEENTFG
jgi:GABA(A) receptor-associated protein